MTKPSSQRDQKSVKSKVWDLVLLKDNGTWEGFRAPEKALRSTIHYLVLLIFVASVSLVGWLWSRWALGRAEVSLAQSHLEIKALKVKVADLRQELLGGSEGATVTELSKQLSYMPSLSAEELLSEDLLMKSLSIGFDTQKELLGLGFEIEKTPRSSLSSERLYWVLFLHGSHGLYAFPSAMVSRSGSWVFPQKGQAIEGLVKNRKVDARFKVQGFFEASGTEPVQGTLLIYDQKGSLLLRKRSGVDIVQIREKK